MIEFSNIMLCLMTSDTINMISNFVAIQIVSSFDEFVYQSMSDEPLKQLLEDRFIQEFLIIQHTSSKKAKEDELSLIKDDSGNTRLLKTTWRGRSTKMNCLRVIYFVCRSYYTSVYFYFIPFLASMISCVIP